MNAGPFCRGVDNKIVACSANATRTKRAGVHELGYELRDDRQYCEYQFFRDRATPEAEGGVEACRAELTARIERCGLTCLTCTALCTSPSVRALVSTYRCSFGLPTLGLFAGFHESDAGLVRPTPLQHHPSLTSALACGGRTSARAGAPTARATRRRTPRARGASSTA